MDGVNLLARAREAGLLVSRAGNNLIIDGHEHLRPLAEVLLRHKSALLPLVELRPENSNEPPDLFEAAEREAISWCETAPDHEVEAALRKTLTSINEWIKTGSLIDADSRPEDSSETIVAIRCPYCGSSDTGHARRYQWCHTCARKLGDSRHHTDCDEGLDLRGWPVGSIPAEEVTPCPICQSLEQWRSPDSQTSGVTFGAWRCVHCDPPDVARHLRAVTQDVKSFLQFQMSRSG